MTYSLSLVNKALQDKIVILFLQNILCDVTQPNLTFMKYLHELMHIEIWHESQEILIAVFTWLSPFRYSYFMGICPT